MKFSKWKEYGRILPCNSKLLWRQRSHNGKKPFKCKERGKAFKSSYACISLPCTHRLLPRVDPLMLGQGGVATQTFAMLLKFVGSYCQLFCLDGGLATCTDASQNLCFPGIGVPWSVPSLQLGDQIGSG